MKVGWPVENDACCRVEKLTRQMITTFSSKLIKDRFRIGSVWLTFLNIWGAAVAQG
jgi:hypothetical protein